MGCKVKELRFGLHKCRTSVFGGFRIVYRSFGIPSRSEMHRAAEHGDSQHV